MRPKNRLYLSFVLIFIHFIGVIALIGCGGDGDGDSSPKGHVRFLNNLKCSDGTGFTARITVGGKEIWSESGQWSGCAEFDLGSYTVEGDFSGCGDGGASATFSINVVENCTEEITLDINVNEVPAFFPEQVCPGSCPVS